HLFALAYAFFQFVYFFFFFQAEDGIRDFHVTGVQTCALPISRYPLRASRSGAARMLLAQESADRFESLVVAVLGWASAASAAPRSEERRVGKECSVWRWRARSVNSLT